MHTTKRAKVRKDYIIPDALWKELVPLIPTHRPPKHPLGMTRPRVSDRDAMNGIFFVLKTGCQWNALNETGICSSSSAHRRFQEWEQKGVFKKIWKQLLTRYDELEGIDWSFCSTDGAMTKAPLGGGKNRQKPH
jgi:transposase